MAVQELNFPFILEWDPAGGSTFAAIAHVHNIAPPEISRESVQTTTYSTTDAHTYKPAPLKEGGEMTLTLAWNDEDGEHDESTGLLSHALDAGTIPNWRITWANTGATTLTFLGFITSFQFQEGEATTTDLILADITIKVTGIHTYA